MPGVLSELLLGSMTYPIGGQDGTAPAIAGGATLTIYKGVAPDTGIITATVTLDVSAVVTLTGPGGTDTVTASDPVVAIPCTAGDTITLTAAATSPVEKVRAAVLFLPQLWLPDGLVINGGGGGGPVVANGEYYVSEVGSDIVGDGKTWATAWATLTHAQATVPNGSVINVGPGIYLETNISPQRTNISVRGAGSFLTTFELTTASAALEITAGINGFSMAGATVLQLGTGDVYVVDDNAFNSVLVECTLAGNHVGGSHAYLIDPSTHGAYNHRTYDCRFVNTAYGIMHTSTGGVQQANQNRHFGPYFVGIGTTCISLDWCVEDVVYGAMSTGSSNALFLSLGANATGNTVAGFASENGGGSAQTYNITAGAAKNYVQGYDNNGTSSVDNNGASSTNTIMLNNGYASMPLLSGAQIVSYGNAPTPNAGANLGSTGSATATGDSVGGVIHLTPGGTGIAAGTQASFSFNPAYSTSHPPNSVNLTPATGGATAANTPQVFISAVANDHFSVSFVNAGISGTNYAWYYRVT